MGEVGAYLTLGRCSLNDVATGAGALLKYLLAVLRRRGGRCGGWLPLLLDPGIELVPRLDGHAQPHPGMFDPTELRAGAHVVAHLVQAHPHLVRLAWDVVHHPPKLRQPEAVDH